MRPRRLVVPALGLALLMAKTAATRADDAAAPSAGPQPVVGAEASPAAPRLKLGPYGHTHRSAGVETLLGAPRFQSTIDVEAKAPPDYNAAMAVWWRHYDLPSPAVYGKGIIYRQPPPPGSVDLVPLIQWLTKKAKEK